jgi:hypothetical protein
VLCEAGVVIGVNNCEFAACQGDFSKGVAVAEPAIKKQQVDTYPFEPKQDWNNDVNNSPSVIRELVNWSLVNWLLAWPSFGPWPKAVPL